VRGSFPRQWKHGHRPPSRIEMCRAHGGLLPQISTDSALAAGEPKLRVMLSDSRDAVAFSVIAEIKGTTPSRPLHPSRTFSAVPHDRGMGHALSRRDHHFALKSLGLGLVALSCVRHRRAETFVRGCWRGRQISAWRRRAPTDVRVPNIVASDQASLGIHRIEKATREHSRMAFRMNCRHSSRFRSPSVGSAA